MFFSGVGRTSCEECIRVWQAYEKPPPCEKCRPEFLGDTHPYLVLYRMCNDQLIVGPGGAIGLNYQAVESIALRLGVPDDEVFDFYSKVRLITSVVLDEQRKEQEQELKRKK